ncbi:class I SAM-dependent methyltransferase [bacterium]|nr:MAG: class I SAM-dependent methyltransferase [bacterium]
MAVHASTKEREGRAADDRRATTVAILRMLFGNELTRTFAVRLWDGTTIQSRGPARFTLLVNAPEALRAALLPPDELNAGRAFVNGLLDCEGDLEAAVDVLQGAFGRLQPRALPTLLTLVLRLPKPRSFDHAGEARLRGRKHSLERDRAAIGFHYDQPIAFYRAFLDREMVYSCAYFDDERAATLDEAQIAKIDHVLRKLRVQTGERLLDIGCGWGALVVRAAERFGARVLGVTLSRRQHEEANRRIQAAGITATARVELRDYRNLRGEQLFDKIVSVGMFEHVGRSHLPEYFSTAYAHLRPGGLFLNHGIAARSGARRSMPREGFVERFVFPDGELVPIGEALQIAERSGFEVRDVENLREHYARTLRCWVANLERNRTAAVEAADERTFRVWRLYMAGSAQGFASGRMGIHQSLLAKPTSSGSVDIPATRRDLYL